MRSEVRKTNNQKNTHMHTPDNHRADWQHLIVKSQALGLSAEAQERLSWIVFYLEHDSSVTDTCTHFNIAPATLRRWMERFDPNDLSLLEERSHKPHQARTSGVSADVVEKIRAYRMAQPLLGKEKIAELLQTEHGVVLSSSTVNRVIERENLYFGTTPLHKKKRLQEEFQNDTTATAVTQETAPIMQNTYAYVEQPRMAVRATGSFRMAFFLAALAAPAALVLMILGTMAMEKMTQPELHAAAPEQTHTVTYTTTLDALATDSDITQP